MMKILVIDDDPDARMIMERLMTKMGYEVETASGREDALSRLKSIRPSAILLDVLLSGDDGRDVCREIKAISGMEAIPVIMISAHPGASENFASYGADDFITKPIRSETLLSKLAMVTGNTK